MRKRFKFLESFGSLFKRLAEHLTRQRFPIRVAYRFLQFLRSGLYIGESYLLQRVPEDIGEFNQASFEQIFPRPAKPLDAYVKKLLQEESAKLYLFLFIRKKENRKVF